jgi:tRNA threonylcarbamoyl adenosine modification protein YeaZ
MYLALSLASSRGLLLLLSESFKVVGQEVWDERETKDHWQILDQRLAKLLSEQSLSPQNLKKIFCVQGPGAYTGLRIAATYAQGLSFAVGAPLIGVPTIALHDGKPFFIPLRHQKVRDLTSAEALANGFEFLLIEEARSASLVNPQGADLVWGTKDSAHCLWPSAENLVRACQLEELHSEPLEVFYGLGAKVFGKYL